MQGRHTAIHIEMPDHTRATLTGWLRKQKTPVGLAKRARAMLLLADGSSFAATARQVELRERHVRKWALRCATQGIDGLSDKKHLAERLLAFVAAWNEHAPPFQWSTKISSPSMKFTGSSKRSRPFS